jgi:hypothetical protein
MAAQRWEGDHEKIQNLTGRVNSIENLLGIKSAKSDVKMADQSKNLTVYDPNENK